MRKHELTEEQADQARMLHGKGRSVAWISRTLGTQYKETRYAINPQSRERERLCSASYARLHKDEKRVHDAEYRKTNRDRIVAYLKNRAGELRLYHTAYRKAHQSELAAWHKAHRSEENARNSARRARIRGSTVGDPAAIKEIYRVAREDRWVRCYLCGDWIALGDRHVDHIIPVSKGGPTSPGNLAVTCSTCNLRKGAKMPCEVGLLL